MSTCCFLPPVLQFVDRSIVPLLLDCSIIGSLTFNCIACIICHTNNISCAHDVAEYNYASVTDSVTTFCVELLAITGDPVKNT